MICPICRREVPELYQEKHHLVPKSKNGKETITICVACGDQIHQLFDNRELAKYYNNIDSILGSEKIQKWIKWVRKKPINSHICMARKKKR